jgi:hypothetical protein
MTRSVAGALVLSLIASVAAAQTPPKHLHLFKSEHDARRHCGKDTVVWASTTTHQLYLPGDKHYAHTHGGFACEAAARALGYRGPRAHA